MSSTRENRNSKRLPEDIWNQIAEFSGLSTLTTLARLCKDTQHVVQDEEKWKMHCRKHFPNKVFSCEGENETTSWLNRFTELQEEKYPSSKRKQLLFRTVKEGNLSDVQELKLTVDELNETEHSNSKPMFKLTLISWANKLGYQDILNYFYDLACDELAPQKIDSRDHDFISYLVMCNQADKFQKLLDVNFRIILHRGPSLFKCCLQSGSKDVLPILIRYFPHLPHINLTEGNKSIPPLLAVSEQGYTEMVAELLNCGLDVNQEAPHGVTAVMLAAQEGHFLTVEALLKLGANVNQTTPNGTSALLLAAQNGHVEIANLLIKQGADVNQLTNGFSSLFAAAQNGHYQIAESLLRHGANVTESILECGSFPLEKATWKGYVSLVELLMSHRADVNQSRSDGVTSLYIAAQQGFVQTAKQLLEHKADVNLLSEKGGSPLLVAGQRGNFEMSKLLLEYKADLHHTTTCDQGLTALILAAREGHLSLVKFLLAQGAKISETTKKGASPLFAAAQNGHLDIVEFLLAQGADPNIGLNDGTSPINIATLNGHHDVATVLSRAIKKPEEKSEVSSDELSKNSFHFLFSSSDIHSSPMDHFKNNAPLGEWIQQRNRLPILFDENGNELSLDQEDKVAHVLLKDCDYLDFVKLIMDIPLSYRIIKEIEIETVKPLLSSQRFKIDIQRILERTPVELKIEVGEKLSKKLR